MHRSACGIAFLVVHRSATALTAEGFRASEVMFRLKRSKSHNGGLPAAKKLRHHS